MTRAPALACPLLGERRLLLGSGLAVFQQVTGIGTIGYAPTVLAAAGAVYLAYATASVLIFLVVWWMVQETTQRSLESLEAAFRNGTWPPAGQAAPERIA